MPEPWLLSFDEVRLEWPHYYSQCLEGLLQFQNLIANSLLIYLRGNELHRDSPTLE